MAKDTESKRLKKQFILFKYNLIRIIILLLPAFAVAVIGNGTNGSLSFFDLIIAKLLLSCVVCLAFWGILAIFGLFGIVVNNLVNLLEVIFFTKKERKFLKDIFSTN